MSLVPANPRKKRIVVDGRMIGAVPHGIARYVTRLAEGIEAHYGELGKTSSAGGAESIEIPYELVFLLGHDAYGEVFKFFPKCEVDTGFLSVTENWQIAAVLRQLEADLFHSPSFSSPAGIPCPWISTVHDLNHLQYGGLKEKLYYRLRLKQFARRASALVTVSEFSRRELAHWLGVESSTIELAPNAMDPSYGEALPEGEVQKVLAKYGLEKGRYFLCFSNAKPHKNVALLVEAYLSAAEPEGSERWPLVLNVPDFGRNRGVRSLSGINDADGRALMEGAGAVVFPSLYEGFGLPPVEATVMGVPLVVSKIPAHHEALVDLEPGEAYWADPKSAADWARVLSEVMERAAQGSLKGASAETRRKVLERYSIERLGSTMDQIYRRVLGINS